MTDYSSTQAAAQPRRVRRSAVLAWGVCAAICVAALAEIVDGLAPPTPDPGGLLVARFAAWGVLPIVFAVPAALIVARHPRNRIGWILMTPAIALVTGTPMDNYLSALPAAPPPTPPLLVTLWFQNWSWMLLILPLPLIMLLFPTGSPPTPRWRWVRTYSIVLLLLIMLLIAFGRNLHPENAGWSVPNPIGFIPDDAYATPFFLGPWIGSLALLIVASAAALFVRYRRAAATERLQIKWLLLAAAIFVVDYVPTLVSQNGSGGDWALSGASDLLMALSIMLLPIAIGVAILRYRVWDIDIIINRTLVYVPLTAIIAGMFSAASTLLQKTFVSLTGSDSLAATVIATVIVVASFNPIKDKVQKAVDRVFKETPDPNRRLKPFQELLRRRVWQLDVTHTTRRFLEEAVAAFEAEGGAAYRVVNGSMQPVHVTGQWHGEEKLAARVDCGGSGIAHIVLAGRRRGRDYADADRKALEQAAAAVSRAIEEDGGCA